MDWIPAADNLREIKKAGLEHWLREQEERRRLLENLLQDYNEGRSMSFYCKVCARMPVNLISRAIRDVNKTLASEQVDESDLKSKAKILKAMIEDLALKTNINLD